MFALGFQMFGTGDTDFMKAYSDGFLFYFLSEVFQLFKNNKNGSIAEAFEPVCENLY